MTVSSKNKAPQAKADEAPLPISMTCLQQAEICREQARDAARLKRFRAAFGLFSTAAALCRRASGIQEADEAMRSLIADRLHQIDVEVAMYGEMARSFERSALAR